MNILTIVNHYFNLLLIVGGFGFILFLVGCYLTIKFTRSQKALMSTMQTNLPQSVDTTFKNNDSIDAIAGEDIYSTYLDLARAYLETNRMTLANELLKQVSENGHDHQKKQANALLEVISNNTTKTKDVQCSAVD